VLRLRLGSALGVRAKVDIRETVSVRVRLRLGSRLELGLLKGMDPNTTAALGEP